MRQEQTGTRFIGIKQEEDDSTHWKLSFVVLGVILIAAALSLTTSAIDVPAEVFISAILVGLGSNRLLASRRSNWFIQTSYTNDIDAPNYKTRWSEAVINKKYLVRIPLLLGLMTLIL